MEIEVQRRRSRGRSKRRWLENARDDQREGTVGRGSVRPCYMEAHIVKHRTHINVGIR